MKSWKDFQSLQWTLLRNCYFLHWNFDWKSCVVVFFHEWKNPQFNFSSQDLSIERNFFKWDGKVTKISHLLFHRIWKKNLFWVPYNNCCKKNRYHTEKLIHNDNVFTIFRKVRLVQKKNCIIKGTKSTLELALFTKKSLNSGAKKEGCTVF